MSRNLLIIASAFPPQDSVGGTMRILKFSKYLSRAGWNVIGLAMDLNSPGMKVSEGQVEGVTKVYRVGYPARGFIESLKFSAPKTRAQDVRRMSYHSLPGGIRGFLRTIVVPDSSILCVPFAVKAGMKAIETERIDVMISVAPSEVTHLVGLGIKKRIDIKWIADFKDMWVGNPLRLKRGEIIEDYWQRKVVNMADVVTVTTDYILVDLEHRYPIPRQRMFLLPNGYDEEDFRCLPMYSPSGNSVTIIHIGSFYRLRSPEPVLKALSDLFRLKPQLKNRLRLRLIGNNFGMDLERAVTDYGLGEVVQIEGSMSHMEVVQIMAMADVLLLIPGADYAIPGKQYEYMASRRPILALTSHQSMSAVLIRETRTGLGISPNDLEAFQQVLARIITSPDCLSQIMEYAPDVKMIREYSRERIAQRLLHLIEDMV